jgi:sec-independent protein translocase protein TatB
MPDFSLAELLLVVVVAVVFIGPKELPVVVRALAKAMRWLKDITKDIREMFNDLAEETGVKDTVDSFNAEIRLIKGDDGNMYESYDLTSIPKDQRNNG